jgi:hypothetical protein
MANLSAYPTNTPKNSDLLVGTKTARPDTEEKPITSNFSISDVSRLISKGYKSFSALITQTGVNAPTMVVLYNDLGFTPTVGMDVTGLSYLSTQSPNVLYNSNKTQILVTPRVTWDPPAVQTLRTIFAAPKTNQTIGFWSFDVNNAASNEYQFFVEIKTFE